ncbi:MAG: hypothetical protein Q4G62_06310 [Pseudomonadota bacterium]|nr:hypothetical protein [Pseudomonadota bacterium]
MNDKNKRRPAPVSDDDLANLFDEMGARSEESEYRDFGTERLVSATASPARRKRPKAKPAAAAVVGSDENEEAPMPRAAVEANLPAVIVVDDLPALAVRVQPVDTPLMQMFKRLQASGRIESTPSPLTRLKSD